MKKIYIVLITLFIMCLSPISCFADDSKTTQLTYIQKAKISFVDEISYKTYEYYYELDSKIIEPEHSELKDYTFGGWYKDAACTQAWNFEKDTVTQNLTLYAKWIANSVDSATIGGNVTEVTCNDPKDTENVPNAIVELYLGTVKVAATTTNTNGVYSFNNVENGTYNIVVTKTDGKTKTELVTINDTGDTTVDVELPLESVNSKVEHTGDEVADTKTAIKQAVVGGLDKAAKSQAEDGKTITIKLQVKPMDESTAPNATEIKQEAGDIDKVEFIDMSLFKQVNSEEAQPIGNDNDVLLTIVIPFDFAGVDVNSVMILRHHGSSEKLTKNPASGEEGFKVDKEAGTITIYAKKFSSYAVAYNNVNDSPTPTPNPDTKPRYKIPNTGVEGTNSNNHSLLKLSSLSLLAIGTYIVIKKKKDND